MLRSVQKIRCDRPLNVETVRESHLVFKAWTLPVSADMGKERDLRDRTMSFALDVRTLCRTFPDTYEGGHVRGQLFRAGTGLAANYRAACRGRSKPEFIAKLGTAIEEGDETDFWLDFAVRAGLLKRGTEVALRKEADELVRILVRSRITAQENLNRASSIAQSTGTVLVTGLLLYVVFRFLF